jgi:hypothetical protein
VRNSVLALALVSFAAARSLAQDPRSVACNFDDGNQVSIQYAAAVKDQPHNGRIWSPSITLYVQVPLTLNGTTIPLGAYTVYLIPGGKSWTLIVNRNVTPGTTYDSAQDVARAPMDLGELPESESQLQLSFAHMSAKQCSLRFY